MGGEHVSDAAFDGLRRVDGGGGNLVEGHCADALVDHGEIGEGATDVYAYAIHGARFRVWGFMNTEQVPDFSVVVLGANGRVERCSK